MNIEQIARECGLQVDRYQISHLVTIEQLQKFANAILEEAAKECDAKERKKWELLYDGGKLEGVGPLDCAAAIRAKKVT